jgi:hypothetical protein
MMSTRVPRQLIKVTASRRNRTQNWGVLSPLSHSSDDANAIPSEASHVESAVRVPDEEGMSGMWTCAFQVISCGEGLMIAPVI